MARAWVWTCFLLALSGQAALAQTPPPDERPVRLGTPQAAPADIVELPLAPPAPSPLAALAPPLPSPMPPLLPPDFNPPPVPDGPVAPPVWPGIRSLIQLDVQLPAPTDGVATPETTSACVWDGTPWGVFDNLSFFAGLNIAKEPADLGINENFGYRFAVNWGLPLVERAGLGIQLGTAINYSRTALHFLPLIDGTVDHFQSFTTLGLFQRSPSG